VSREIITAIAGIAEAPGDHNARSPACALVWEPPPFTGITSSDVMPAYVGIQSLYYAVHANPDRSRYPRAASFFPVHCIGCFSTSRVGPVTASLSLGLLDL